MPKVFISYTHDSPDHRKLVNSFSERLRKDGIETILDQHVNGTPSEGWPRWMTNGLEDADHVLVVCTEIYYRRFRGKEEPGKGKGGDWEGAWITQEIYDSRSTTAKFVPVFLSPANANHIPDPLRLHTHYSLVSEDAYELLYDFLLSQAGVQPGLVGNPRLKPRPTAKPLNFEAPSAVPATSKPSNLPSGYVGRIFVGRDDFLTRLRQSLLGAGHATAITQKSAATGISGLGGIGKTHSAVAYAEAYKDEYAALLFASADTPAKLHTSLAGLCDVLPLNEDGNLPPDEPTRLRVALDWLSSNPGWLLIIDNVDDKSSALALRELFGRMTLGHVLVTSRIHGWSDQVKNLDLDVLEESDAAHLLLQLTEERRRKATDDDEQALQLARLLDGLPLAIHQAAGFIKERTLTLAKYLAHYLRESETLLGWFDDFTVPYQRPVVVTWQTSFEQLTEDEQFWLLVFSHFSPDPIPEFLLEPMESATPEQVIQLNKANSAVARSEKFCLLTRDRVEPVFKIHRLVQQITRSQATEDERIRATIQAIRLIQMTEPGEPQDVRNWPKWSALQSHTVSIRKLAPDSPPTAEWVFLLEEMGCFYHSKALYSEAEVVMRHALRDSRTGFGKKHSKVATQLNNLAQLLQNTDRLSEAEPLMREALDIDRVALGRDHPKVAIRLNNLAQLLQATDRLEEVEDLILEALDIDRTVYGKDHPKVATRLNNLAQLFKATGRMAEAEALIQDALRIDRAALGNDHLDVAIDLHNLAQLFKATNRFAEAKPAMHDALRIFKATLGHEHPDTLRVAQNLEILISQETAAAEKSGNRSHRE